MTAWLDWFSRHARWLGFPLLALILLVTLALDRGGGHLAALEWPLRDVLLRELRDHPEPVANDVIVVAFDEAYLAGAREPLALFHGHLANALETLAALQPAVIGVDFALPEKSFRFLAPRDQPEQDFDRLLLAGLARSARQTPVILAATLDESGGRYRAMLPEYLSAASLSPTLQQLGVDPRGSVILCPDSDGLIRRYPDETCRGGPGALPPLAAGMAAAQGMRMQSWRGDINFLAGPAPAILKVQDLLALAADPEGRAELSRRIRGKAVLLGAVLDYEDRHRVPVPLMADNLRSQQVPGILIQAQIYRSLMNQGLLRPLGLATVWPGLLLALLFWFGRRHTLKLGLLALTGAALVMFAREGLQRGVELPVTLLWLTAALSWGLRWLLDLRRQQLTRQHLAEAFSGTTSPALLRHLETHGSGELSRARHAPVVVLGLRLDGPLGDGDAEARLQAINAWQHQARAIADQHDGLAEAGTPDQMLLLFGQPLPLFAPERQALEAARDLLAAWRDLPARPDLGTLRLTAVVASGTALVGCLQDGAPARYAILGELRDDVRGLLARAAEAGHALAATEAVAAALGHPPQLLPATDGLRVWREEAGHVR